MAAGSVSRSPLPAGLARGEGAERRRRAAERDEGAAGRGGGLDVTVTFPP